MAGVACAAYIQAPDSSGGMAWVIVESTRDVAGVRVAGAIQVALPESRGGVLWELGGCDQGEGFGWSIARVDDVDGDGWDEIAVGAPWAEASGMYARGSVRLVSGRTGVTVWRIDGRTAFGQLGISVGRIEDWDGDGTGDIVACELAVGENQGSRKCDRVEVLSGRTGESLWQADIAWDPNPGISVCAGEDLDADGREDIVVGNSSSRGGGCVQVLGSRTGSVVWRVEGGFEDGWFGHRVTRLRDFDGDGVRDLLVTAPMEGDGGVLHLLSGRDGSGLRVLGGKPGEHLGTELFEVPDHDGDGVAEVGVRFDGKDEWEVRIYSGRNLAPIGDYPIAGFR